MKKEETIFVTKPYLEDIDIISKSDKYPIHGHEYIDYYFDGETKIRHTHTNKWEIINSDIVRRLKEIKAIKLIVDNKPSLITVITRKNYITNIKGFVEYIEAYNISNERIYFGYQLLIENINESLSKEIKILEKETLPIVSMYKYLEHLLKSNNRNSIV